MATGSVPRLFHDPGNDLAVKMPADIGILPYILSEGKNPKAGRNLWGSGQPQIRPLLAI
jgi:hypothetical protein